VQQRIGERRTPTEVRGVAQELRQRVPVGQRLESDEEIAHPVISRFDPDPSAELLQHVNAGSPVLRVHHKV
jgi:hypothetical protein